MIRIAWSPPTHVHMSQVCLGQEEQKVALLSEKLAGYGVDVEALLATVKDNEEEEDGLQ